MGKERRKRGGLWLKRFKRDGGVVQMRKEGTAPNRTKEL